MQPVFYPWKRSGAHALTTTLTGARRSGAVELQFTGMSGPGFAKVKMPFSLLGPADVTGLHAGAIRRRHPLPGVGDAVPQLAAHVELAAADLPWRYSPDAPPGGAGPMRPWLVLLAGADADIIPLGRSRVRIAQKVLDFAKLGSSHRWAHVHHDERGDVSRILSPCPLTQRTLCRAALVPAYRLNPGGGLSDSWTDPAPAWVELPLYDTWTFTTAEDDDFPLLARQLKMKTAGELGDNFGRTTIRLRDQTADNGLPYTTGALMRPDDVGAEPASPSETGDEVAAWTILEADGRWVLAPPEYDRPWRQGKDAAAGWPTELLRDLRRRGAAGLGAWCAIDQQDQLADGARRQAGAIDAAAHDFRMLGLGLAAGVSLFKRRLPPASDPVGRLAVLGPVLRRLPSNEGGTAERALSGRTPYLHPALLSGAVRRMIRPGTALYAGAQPKPTVAGLLEAANRCPGRARPTPFTEIFRTLGGEPAPAAVSKVVNDWARDLGPFRAAAMAGASEVSKQVRILSEERRPRSCRRADLDRLGNSLSDAVDPSRSDAPAIRRIRARYPNLTDPLPAPVFEPELDLPLAPVLKELAPQWLLPGRGELKQHMIVALASNSSFVESALVGANHRALAELRWRNVRVRSGWSPLRRFWPRPEESDISPIRVWTNELGHSSHRPAGETADMLVVVMRSPILRRYPATAIYLLDKSVDVNALVTAKASPPPAPPLRIFPIFKGSLEPDLQYIGFPVTPQQAANFHLVLEEPPAEPRFRLGPPFNKLPKAPGISVNDAPDGAVYAGITFHRRTIAVITLKI
jgi:hypothetical protein